VNFKRYLVNYGFISLFELAISFVYTKSLFINARFIRGRVDFRGIKSIEFGINFTCGRGVRIETNPHCNKKTLFIGDNVEFNDRVHITAFSSVIIGNNVLLASNIYISDTIHGSYVGDKFDSPPTLPPNSRKLSYKSVRISDNVWIGEGVCILPGVTIGKGVIIGANSVVTKNIPDYTIAVGSPARVIKIFDFESNLWKKI
jgi:acetyltransferase-like isoleucine patch superfamily enzyme